MLKKLLLLKERTKKTSQKARRQGKRVKLYLRKAKTKKMKKGNQNPSRVGKDQESQMSFKFRMRKKMRRRKTS